VQLSTVSNLGVEINRDASVTLFSFTDYFRGFEKIQAVRSLFEEKTESILKNLKVEFFSAKFGYMSVSDEDGHLLISTHHLKNSSQKILYLDIIHELFHVKQFMEGTKLFQEEFEYVDSPTEIPAYQFAVKEARRLGMSREEILEYLKVEWISDEAHARLVKAVGL
jgi:hypothetical protein